jgi:hypothetical protein
MSYYLDSLKFSRQPAKGRLELLKKTPWACAKPGWMAFLISVAFAVTPKATLALSASELVIVYNRNLSESQAVASYYAKQRMVPAGNLVGVDVPATEEI